MKTADLIADLSRDVRPVAPGATDRLLAFAQAIGITAAAALAVAWLGMRPMAEAVATSAFWMKATYTLVLGLAGVLIVRRLAQPGRSSGRAVWIIVLALAAMTALGVVELASAPVGDRMRLWLGSSATLCPWRILALSIPAFVALALAMRRLAPTRLASAGAAAGFLAGALGATVYQLHCPETGAMFVTTWYTLGVALSAALGGLLGPRLLRW